MAKKTLEEDELSRDEVAEQLRALADEFEGEGPANVKTGNKIITVTPPSAVAYEVGVRESSSILRGNRETITIKMDWRPE